ncbi:MAG: amino acid ABC transporter ATP-binding protein [Herbiconiux sp.]|nr:amino acid ABC transporter ATP-binding protein [Herbiconiux sp.]
MTVTERGDMVEQPLLEVDRLSKSFGSHSVLSDVSFSIDRGEVIALIGPSGGGKSTLLRCLNQLELPTSGQVRLAGADLVRVKDAKPVPQTTASLHRLRRRVGMVFQQFNLFANMTAEQNIVFAQRAALGVSTSDAVDRARSLLRRVNLGDKRDHLPSQLSGGQQQRVAIARSLALDPDLILFDEPTSAIDPEIRTEVLAVMKELADGGMTMLISTHEMSFAERVSDRTIFLCAGTILEQGPSATLLGDPQHERTRQFLNALSQG